MAGALEELPGLELENLQPALLVEAGHEARIKPQKITQPRHPTAYVN